MGADAQAVEVEEPKHITPAPIEAIDSTITTTSSPTSSLPSTPVKAPAAWERVIAPTNCMCGDGSEFSFYVLNRDPSKVLFFIRGGGACFDANSCDPSALLYSRSINPPPALDAGEGIFDFDNEANPFAEYSIVFVPYCTGDMHLGNKLQNYGTSDAGSQVVVHHNGYVNTSSALLELARRFPIARKVVVAGQSAGAVPAPLFGALAQDLLPSAAVVVVADGAGVYPDSPSVNRRIADSWGILNALPNWATGVDDQPGTWSIPGLFVQAAEHAPDVAFSRHDNAIDSTQVFYAQLAGFLPQDLVNPIDSNGRAIEAAGVTLLDFIASGDGHTVLHRPEFYTESVRGVLFRDWLAALISGLPVADNHCLNC